MSVSNLFEGEHFSLQGRHLDMQHRNIINLPDPTEDHHVATKSYIDQAGSTLALTFPINPAKFDSDIPHIFKVYEDDMIALYVNTLLRLVQARKVSTDILVEYQYIGIHAYTSDETANLPDPNYVQLSSSQTEFDIINNFTTNTMFDFSVITMAQARMYHKAIILDQNNASSPSYEFELIRPESIDEAHYFRVHLTKHSSPQALSTISE